MRVLCLNAWGGTLADALIPYLVSQAPDVLCLQEVVDTPASDARWLAYRDGDLVLPQRANLFRELVDAFPDHVAGFFPAAEGVLWRDDVAVPSRFGLATLVHRSLTILSSVETFVHKEFSQDGFGEHPRPRNAHGVRLRDASRDLVVSVTHVHGLRDPRGKADTPERAAQARRLLEASSRVSRAGDLRIVCGDFNVEPDSETLRLFEARGFVELVTQRGFDGTRTSLYRKPGRFADYLLVDDEARVETFTVVDAPEVSDHRPLLLEVRGGPTFGGGKDNGNRPARP
ncbi:endonuclease/exonuclease/phosphatase family protein [Salinarimonas sp.]|uniref:endonuclease/exonuclease/phosphatase family protein n=1 Tax=Salinarimonas sp. TaxID=2766526 RepID=UPI00391A285E